MKHTQISVHMIFRWYRCFLITFHCVNFDEFGVGSVGLVWFGLVDTVFVVVKMFFSELHWDLGIL